LKSNQSLKLLCLLLNHTVPQIDTITDLQYLDRQSWENLLETNIQQGLKPLVYSTFKPFFGKTAIPASIQNDLRDAYLHSIRKNTLILHHAAKMLKALKAREIDVINM